MKLSLRRLEEIFCAGGKPSSESADFRALTVQMAKPDALKSEFLSAEEAGLSPFLKIRSAIFRGNLHSARESLFKLQPDGSAEFLVESKVEAARLACFEGDWQVALRLTDETFELGPSPLNRLTLHQIRGTAFFVREEFTSAYQEWQLAKSFEFAYPNAQSAFYIRVLGARLQVRMRGATAGRKALDELWKELSGSELNRDHLLSVLRIELELCNFQGNSGMHLAIACFVVAQAMGDNLYRDLALVEIYSFADSLLKTHLKAFVEEATRRFKRVSLELERAFLENRQKSAVSVEEFESLISSTLVAVPRFGYVFDIFQSETLCLKPESRANQALEVARFRRMKKSEFFKHLWGKQHYSSRLHDRLIWTVLSRLRKSCRIECKCEDDQIKFQGLVVLSEI